MNRQEVRCRKLIQEGRTQKLRSYKKHLLLTVKPVPDRMQTKAPNEFFCFLFLSLAFHTERKIQKY